MLRTKENITDTKLDVDAWNDARMLAFIEHHQPGAKQMRDNILFDLSFLAFAAACFGSVGGIALFFHFYVVN